MNTAHLGHLPEYLRPWKLITLAVGIALLILGSLYDEAPDWDIPISFIMAIFAYLTAPWSIRVLLERKWRLWRVMLFFTWVTVDGCYVIYWHFKNPVALELMRGVNFPPHYPYTVYVASFGCIAEVLGNSSRKFRITSLSAEETRNEILAQPLAL